MPARHPAPPERALLAAFAAVIAFGCALRFWRLPELGFWYDELWAVVGANDRPLAEIYREWVLGDSHPPGFFLANFFWFKLAPATEFWARLPHALAAVGTVLFLLTAARPVLSRDERVMTAALLSLSYLAIYYGFEVKQYSWVLLFATIGTIAYLQIVGQQTVTRRNAILLGASVVAMSWLDYFATGYGGLLFLMLFVTFRNEPAARRSVFLLACVCGLLYVPILPFLYYQLTYESGSWQSPDTARFVPDLLSQAFFRDVTWIGGGLGVLAVSLVWAAFRDLEVRALMRSDRVAHIVALAVGISAIIAAVGVWQPIFFPRYFLVTFPAWFLVIGIAAASAFPIRSGWRAVLPLVFFAKAAVVQTYSVEAVQRQDWGKSVDFVLERLTPADTVLVLGAAPDETSFDYLRAGDVNGVFYVKNVKFYEYYFERRGAPGIAARLGVVEPTAAAADGLIQRFGRASSRIYVLAGHHIGFAPDAYTRLSLAFSVQTVQMFSTRVYILTPRSQPPQKLASAAMPIAPATVGTRSPADPPVSARDSQPGAITSATPVR